MPADGIRWFEWERQKMSVKLLQNQRGVSLHARFASACRLKECVLPQKLLSARNGFTAKFMKMFPFPDS